MLATHLHVSRTLVREALARLAAEGLVEAGRKDAPRSPSPSRAEAQSVLEARACLEREVVRLVIARWRCRWARRWKAMQRSEEEAARTSRRPSARGWPANSTSGCRRWRATP